VAERFNLLDFGTVSRGIAPLVFIFARFKKKLRYNYIGCLVTYIWNFKVRECLSMAEHMKWFFFWISLVMIVWHA